MTSAVSIRRAAARDIAEARAWYEAQQVGLSTEFLDELEAALARIGEGPLQFPQVHRDARRALVRRFPYTKQHNQ